MKIEEFDFQPTLTGPTILIRPIQPSDWHGMFTAASDPEIWAVHPASDRYQEPAFRVFFDSALQSGSAFTFVDLEARQIIGSSRYHGLDISNNEVEIGWTFLARSHWGGRTNREVKHLMLTHAFRYVETVIFWVGETNVRSRRAMEKIGGVLRPGLSHRTLNARSYPHVIYEISRSDYQNQAASC